MRSFLFLNGSTRPVAEMGNSVTLAKLAAGHLPDGATQHWVDLARLSLPSFEDQRHTTGVYPMPEGDSKILLEATLAATDLVMVSPVYWF